MHRRLLFLALVLSAFAPSAASAHEGNPNYRSEIDRIAPAIDGLDVEVVNFDDSLVLRNETGKTVEVVGYEGEPYVRISPDGTVEVNEASPTFHLNRDRFAEVDVPESASADAPPRWREVSESGEYAWHDHRIHYMAKGTPKQVTDESARTKIFDYEIPLRVGERPARIAGTLYWVGQDEGFPVAPFVVLAAVALVLAAVAVIRRRRSGPDPGERGEAW